MTLSKTPSRRVAILIYPYLMKSDNEGLLAIFDYSYQDTPQELPLACIDLGYAPSTITKGLEEIKSNLPGHFTVCIPCSIVAFDILIPLSEISSRAITHTDSLWYAPSKGSLMEYLSLGLLSQKLNLPSYQYANTLSNFLSPTLCFSFTCYFPDNISSRSGLPCADAVPWS